METELLVRFTPAHTSNELTLVSCALMLTHSEMKSPYAGCQKNTKVLARVPEFLVSFCRAHCITSQAIL